jgi:tetratricopeptide (TPR) repeat protein
VVWRRLEPSHRLPAGQRPAAQALALWLLTEGKRPDGTRDIDLRFGSELVQLDPEDVNPYLLYCDIAKNTAQHRDQIDLALIRRGIALARGNPKPWGRLVRALASYLELFAAADASALEELGAVSKDVDASGWSGHDVAMALCHFGNALRHHGRIADAVEAYRRATNLWSDGLTPVGRLAHALFVQARSPDTPAASLDDARRQLDRFFELLHASDEKDENLTIQVTQAACLALETHVGDEASVTLCRRALDAVPKGHMAHVALRHTLLLCRQNAAPAELTRALMDMSQRTDTWVSGIQKTEYPDAVRQGRALAELGRTLAQEVTRGEVTHAEVGRRLRTGFGLTGMETALGQRRSP